MKRKIALSVHWMPIAMIMKMGSSLGWKGFTVLLYIAWSCEKYQEHGYMYWSRNYPITDSLGRVNKFTLIPLEKLDFPRIYVVVTF